MENEESSQSMDEQSAANKANRRTKYCGICRKSETREFLKHFRDHHKDVEPCEYVVGADGEGHVVPYFIRSKKPQMPLPVEKPHA